MVEAHIQVPPIIAVSKSVIYIYKYKIDFIFICNSICNLCIMFSCTHCQRNYQRKLYFDRHVIACQFLTKTKKERALETEELADTPTLRNLYDLVLALAAKCNTLETKLTELSKWTDMTKEKLNITDWLNTTYPTSVDYQDWFKTLDVTAADLSILFDTDYVNAVVKVLKEALKTDNRPVRAFTSKENTFYIYQNAKWDKCDEDTFTKLMYRLDKEFMREFIVWQTANKSKMATDDSFTDLYAKNMKKIMGGNFTREQLYTRIKKELFAHLRSEPPNIVKYECTF